MTRRRPAAGSAFRRGSAPPSRVKRGPAPAPRTRNPLLAGLGFALVAVAIVFFFVSTRQSPITFEFDRTEFVARWNEAALDAGQPALTIPDVDWTDEEAGVFGYAFSETMSVLGRVDRTPIQDIEELALVGEPAIDGEDLVIAGMELVIRVTEPALGATERTALLTDLAVLGTLPADPDQRTTAGTTEYRVAADAVGGVLGIGARPIGVSD
ncbi:MAG: hypothetical protein OEQ47_11470 [Acidimicrobiia bacterium]|nr:hypothetical protein [Acidimicrobiia bacterium]